MDAYGIQLHVNMRQKMVILKFCNGCWKMDIHGIVEYIHMLL